MPSERAYHGALVWSRLAHVAGLREPRLKPGCRSDPLVRGGQSSAGVQLLPPGDAGARPERVPERPGRRALLPGSAVLARPHPDGARAPGAADPVLDDRGRERSDGTA